MILQAAAQTAEGISYTGEVIIAVVGGVMAVIQALTLFILGDLRQRIMRLETAAMKQGAVE